MKIAKMRISRSTSKNSAFEMLIAKTEKKKEQEQRPECVISCYFVAKNSVYVEIFNSKGVSVAGRCFTVRHHWSMGTCIAAMPHNLHSHQTGKIIYVNQ